MNRTNNSKIIYCFFVLVMLLLVGSTRTQHWTYGKKGCGGLSLTWTGTAKINTILFCNLTSPTTFTAGLITFGWPWPCIAIPDSITKTSNCFACIYPLAARAFVTDRNGWFSQAIGIPNDRSLRGLAVGCQFWLYNPEDKNGWSVGQPWLWASSNPGWFIVRS